MQSSTGNFSLYLNEWHVQTKYSRALKNVSALLHLLTLSSLMMLTKLSFSFSLLNVIKLYPPSTDEYELFSWIPPRMSHIIHSTRQQDSLEITPNFLNLTGNTFSWMKTHTHTHTHAFFDILLKCKGTHSWKRGMMFKYGCLSSVTGRWDSCSHLKMLSASLSTKIAFSYQKTISDS